MDSRPALFSFSLRSLLILVAMLAILLAQRPYTVHPLEGGPLYFRLVNGDRLRKSGAMGGPREFTNRFKSVAAAEGIFLAIWIAGTLYLRRFPAANGPANRRDNGARRWFRFSLSTALVAMAVFSAGCAFLTFEWRTARERKAALAAVLNENDPPFEVTPGAVKKPSWVGSLGRWDMQMFCYVSPQKTSWLRRVMNDESVDSITIGFEVSPENLERLSRAFPEAKITFDP